MMVIQQPTHYIELNGALIYLYGIHSNISHTVHVLSQCVHVPTSAHYTSLLSVLYYFLGTMTQSLLFPQDSFQLF